MKNNILNSLIFIFTFLPCTVSSGALSKPQKAITAKTDYYSIKSTYPYESLDKNNAIKEFVENMVRQKQQEWKNKLPKKGSAKPEYTLSYQKYQSQKLQTVSYLFSAREVLDANVNKIAVSSFTFNKNGKLGINSLLNLEKANDIKLSWVLAEKAMQNRLSKKQLYNGLGLNYLKKDSVTIDKTKCKCDGYFFGSNFQNFVIKDDGIIFFFNNQQIAPSAQEIKLDWLSLKPFLSK